MICFVTVTCCGLVIGNVWSWIRIPVFVLKRGPLGVGVNWLFVASLSPPRSTEVSFVAFEACMKSFSLICPLRQANKEIRNQWHDWTNWFIDQSWSVTDICIPFTPTQSCNREHLIIARHREYKELLIKRVQWHFFSLFLKKANCSKKFRPVKIFLKQFKLHKTIIIIPDVRPCLGY